MAVNENFQIDGSEELADKISYRGLIRKLLYIAHTHPDISYSESYLSRFMSQPNKAHFCAAKRVVRYLTSTINIGL